MIRWLFALMSIAGVASANDLVVEKQTLAESETTTITLSLEGEFANRDTVNVPVQNLTFLGEPWVSSEFAWINGDVVRRKVFRFRVRPKSPGAAYVGPLTLDAEDGQRDTFPQIVIQVLPDRAAGTNDPEAALRELLATGRDPFFVIAEIDKTSVFVGEQFVVTWVLYNAANVQQWQIGNVPKLEDFWAEEIDVRRAVPEHTFVGGMMMQKLPIRRVALFPLRSGRFPISGMTLDAAVMRRIRGGPFSMFEGNLTEVSFTSAPLTVDVKPLPDGIRTDAIGELSLSCTGPDQANGGPVVVTAILRGTGNVRAASAPQFERAVAGNVQVDAGEVAVDKETRAILMTRKWRYLIFPRAAGTLAIPSLRMSVFEPSTAQVRELRCAAATLIAEAAMPPSENVVAPEVRRANLVRRVVPWIVGAVLAALFVAIAVPRVRRALRMRREVREIVSGTPSEIRERIEARLGAGSRTLLADRTERGDAYRALHSILMAMEQDRDIAEGAEKDLERRVRDLLSIPSR